MFSAVILAAALVTTPHLGVSEAPAAVISTGHAHASFTIGNLGNKPEHIVIQVTTTRPVVNNPNLYVPESEYDHYKVSKPEFNLNPGQHQTVVVSITNPAGYAEHLAVVAEASSIAPTGTARPHAAVAAKWTVTGKPGHAASPVTLPKPHSTAGLPILPIGAGAALLAILLAAWGVFRRRSRRTGKPEQDNPYGFIP